MKRVNLQDVNAIKSLLAGERVYLSGVMYTARDAAHKMMFNCIKSADKLPIDIKNATIFYVGAIFDEAGNVVSAGPTTSTRMDAYAPTLYDNGLLVSIGKGDRSAEVYEAIKRNGGVYIAAIGGAAALYRAAVKSAALVAYPELGTEAIYRFEVEDFPVIVGIDGKGNSIF